MFRMASFRRAQAPNFKAAGIQGQYCFPAAEEFAVHPANDHLVYLLAMRRMC